jgi:uncharacterized protein (DUF488 family)
MSDQATDEDVAKARELLRGGNPLTIGLQIKLLARLERVEAVIQNSKQATTACAHDFESTTGLSHNDPITWNCCKKCNYGFWS